MKFVIRGIVFGGICYGVGYVHGMKAGVKVGNGIKEMGLGMQVLGRELAFQRKLDETREEESPTPTVNNATVIEDDDLTIEDKVRQMGMDRVATARSNKDIADELGIPENHVREILGNSTVDVQ